MAIDALRTWFTDSFWNCSHFRDTSDRPFWGTLTVGSHHLSSLLLPFSDSSASLDTYENSFWSLKFSRQSCSLMYDQIRMIKIIAHNEEKSFLTRKVIDVGFFGSYNEHCIELSQGWDVH